MGYEKDLFFAIGGELKVYDWKRRDITPAGQKEKAILAILALEKGHRLSRERLRSLLWSGRFPEQSFASLRRALSNIKKAHSTAAFYLETDRKHVSLNAKVVFERTDSTLPDSAVLDDLVINDHGFQQYKLNRHTSGFGSFAPSDRLGVVRELTLISVESMILHESSELRFIERFFVDLLSGRLRSLGDVVVQIKENTGKESLSNDQYSCRFLIETTVIDDEWFAHLRVYEGMGQNYLWSGRLRLPLRLKEICEGPAVSEFVGRASATAAELLGKMDSPKARSFSGIYNISKRLFSGDRELILSADQDLQVLQGFDQSGVALAWRAFSRMTQAIEFSNFDEQLCAEALKLAEEALSMAVANPLVFSLASQVEMKLSGDFNRGLYLANEAVGNCEHDPYALHSLSQARLFEGNFIEANKLADWAQRAARSLPNSFCWDFQLCLTSLSLGKIQKARQLAFAAHVKAPNYRPALRYLVALSFILEDWPLVKKYAAKLQGIEPDFSIAKMAEDTYPIETLRVLGSHQKLLHPMPMDS